MENRKNGIISKRVFEFESVIHSIFTFRNDFGFASESTEVMAGIGVVGLDDVRMSLTDNMAVRRQNLGKGIPVVGIENAIRQVFQFCIKAFESPLVTLSKYPRNCSS